jgi:hypothetical protein
MLSRPPRRGWRHVGRPCAGNGEEASGVPREGKPKGQGAGIQAVPVAPGPSGAMALALRSGRHCLPSRAATARCRGLVRTHMRLRHRVARKTFPRRPRADDRYACLAALLHNGLSHSIHRPQRKDASEHQRQLRPGRPLQPFSGPWFGLSYVSLGWCRRSARRNR